MPNQNAPTATTIGVISITLQNARLGSGVDVSGDRGISVHGNQGIGMTSPGLGVVVAVTVVVGYPD